MGGVEGFQAASEYSSYGRGEGLNWIRQFAAVEDGEDIKGVGRVLAPSRVKRQSLGRPQGMAVHPLAEVLDVPFRDRNALLVAAGFAPLHPALPWPRAELTQVQRALTRLLWHKEP